MSIKYYCCQWCFAYPAIKQLALERLKTAATKYFVNIPPQVYSISTSYRANGCCQVTYVSNVAFIYSKFLNTSPLEIATDFATFYAQAEVQQPDFAISVVSPGFLQLKLTELKLANWLQCLPLGALVLANLPLPEYPKTLSNKADLFAIQYAHARCYSLMQLAQREGLITLEEISANQIKSMFPDLICFPEATRVLTINPTQTLLELNDSQQLQLDHSEYALIIQLVKVVDDLCCSPINLDYWAKLAINLSRTFADFYSHCRIFSEIKTQRPKLAQSRLSLILATYTVLKLLLQRLGVFAPIEL